MILIMTFIARRYFFRLYTIPSQQRQGMLYFVAVTILYFFEDIRDYRILHSEFLFMTVALCLVANFTSNCWELYNSQHSSCNGTPRTCRLRFQNIKRCY